MDFAYDVKADSDEVQIFMLKDNKIHDLGIFVTHNPAENARPFLEAIGDGIVRACRKAKREKLILPAKGEEKHQE